MQCDGSIFAAGLDDPEATQHAVQRADEDAVVAERVDGTVVAELLVEGRREDEDIGGQHPAGVIGHH